MGDIDACKLCFKIFDRSVRPHCLPCGYTFCGSCISNLVEEGKIACPKCKLIHQADADAEFPINYDLEEFISSCKDTASQEETALRSSKLKSLIDEQKKHAQTILAQSEELEDQIKEYYSFLLHRKEKHGEILQKIMSLTRRNETVISKIEEEHRKLENTRREVGVLRERVKIKLSGLDTGTNSKSVVSAIAELDKSIAFLEEWNKLSRNTLPNARVVSSSLKVLVDSTSSMSIVDYSDDETDVPDVSQLELTIQEKIEKISGNGTLNFQKLELLSDPLRKLLEDGKVVAVQPKLGNTRSARLSINGEGIYLHYLQEEEIPSHVHTINHSEVIDNLNKDSTVVFLDLAWGGTLKGRVHILLHPDTPLAQQFRILCTAELGPCYVTTKFYSVGNQAQNTECLYGGDYLNNNGTGGASVVNLPKDDESYTRQLRQGIVCATRGVVEGPLGAQFYIVTGAGNILVNYPSVFGKVKDGMEVLKAATNAPLGQVEIKDCGVLLPIQL